MKRLLFMVALVIALPAAAQDELSPDSIAVLEDSLWVREAFERALREYYMNGQVRYGGETTGDRASCNANMRQECFGGDVDALVCPHGIVECIPEDPEGDRDFMLEELHIGLEQLPGDAFVVQQTVYALAKFDREDEALAILDDCGIEAWRCAALEAHVRHRTEHWSASVEAFDRALRSMPDSLRCAWNDLTPILPPEMRADYIATPCGERSELHARVWWMADPAWMIDGNERRIGHYARMAHIWLHEQLWSLQRNLVMSTGDESGGGFYDQGADEREYPAFDGHNAHHALDVELRGGHRGVVAIGFQDSWFHNGLVDAAENREGHWRQWVSLRGARYHFVPRAGALLDPWATTPDDYILIDPDAWERFTTHRTFAPLDHQISWFRRGDRAEVAAAVDLARDRLMGDGPRFAGWFLRPRNGEGVTSVTRQSRDRYVFREAVDDQVYLSALEVADAGHLARTRYAVRPPWRDDARGPVSLSGLLLYRPLGQFRPTSLEEAVSGMRGTHRWEEGAEVGVFWEYYGLIPGPVVQVSVRMIPLDDSGAPLANAVDPLLSWTDEAERALPVFPRAVTLDLGLLEPGSYRMVFTVRVPGQAPMVRSRSVRIEPNPGG